MCSFEFSAGFGGQRAGCQDGPGPGGEFGGLQGPTISPIITREANQGWHSVTVVVRRDHLTQAIAELRGIGGSGIIVSPVTYIFEEEPPRYTAMLAALK